MLSGFKHWHVKSMLACECSFCQILWKQPLCVLMFQIHLLFLCFYCPSNGDEFLCTVNTTARLTVSWSESHFAVFCSMSFPPKILTLLAKHLMPYELFLSMWPRQICKSVHHTASCKESYVNEAWESQAECRFCCLRNPTDSFVRFVRLCPRLHKSFLYHEQFQTTDKKEVWRLAEFENVHVLQHCVILSFTCLVLYDTRWSFTYIYYNMF